MTTDQVEKTGDDGTVTPEVIKNVGGRPKAKIDWDIVEQMLAAWSSGVDIADYYAIERHTLYRRCMEEKGIPFSELQSQSRQKTRHMLRATQLREAKGYEYETTEEEYVLVKEDGKPPKKELKKQTIKKHRHPPNTAMLIWLGKNILGQSDMPEGGSGFGNVPAYRLVGDDDEGDAPDTDLTGLPEGEEGGTDYTDRFNEDDDDDPEEESDDDY